MHLIHKIDGNEVMPKPFTINLHELFGKIWDFRGFSKDTGLF